MTTPQEKAQCVSWFIETKSDTQVQRNYRTKYGKVPPSRGSIREWHKKFMETGSVLHRAGAGRRRTSVDDVDRVRTAFDRSPSKSIRTASRQLNLPRSTVHKVLHKRLRLYAYKIQILHALQPNDRPQRKEFAINMLARMDDDNDFLHRVCFSDEATFHVSGILNRHNVRIWGSENPHETRELQRSSPKVNVWCGAMFDQIIGPVFFESQSVTASNYLDILKSYVVPQLDSLQPTVIFQQDGAPPHWGLTVRKFLNDKFPDLWIGRDGPIPWPPRSPDITPMDFFVWGYVKDIVYRTPVQDLNDLKQRIRNAISTITEEMLRHTWLEIEYRLDVLRATNGAHVETY